MNFAALYSPSCDASALVSVAQAFTPRYECLGPIVLLDMSGVSRLFGDPREVGHYLWREAVGLKPDTGVAMAPSATAAMLLVLRCPALTIASAEALPRMLAALPVDVLHDWERAMAQARPLAPPSPDRHDPRHPRGVLTAGWAHPRDTHQASRTRADRAATATISTTTLTAAERRARELDAASHDRLQVLRRWGISTLGAFVALPREDVFERLGPAGTRWQRVALAEDARPLVPQIEDARYEASLELEWPIEGLEPLSFVLARLLEPLCQRLAREQRGAAMLHTELRLVTRELHTRRLQLPAPMRDPKTLRTLVLLDLESVPPHAAIDIVRLRLDPTPGRVQQWALFERAQPSPEQVATLLARLTALMGDGHVGIPVIVDSWKPGAFALQEFKVQSAKFKEEDAEADTVNCAVRRFRLPVPARVTMHEGRPVRVQVDRRGLVSGTVVTSAGPWRTSGEWWGMGQAGKASQAPWNRDEWDAVLTDGTVYRLFVERDIGQWFIEALVD